MTRRSPRSTAPIAVTITREPNAAQQAHFGAYLAREAALRGTPITTPVQPDEAESAESAAD